MEMISNPWLEFLVAPFVGVIVGYLTRALTTRRERKKSDLEIINAAITPLLESIKQLTEQNRELVLKLADEQRKTLEYMRSNRSLLEERAELISKVDRLTKQIELLKKMLREHLKDANQNDD